MLKQDVQLKTNDHVKATSSCICGYYKKGAIGVVTRTDGKFVKILFHSGEFEKMDMMGGWWAHPNDFEKISR